MSPSPYDVWLKSCDSPEITLFILMPNGLLIPLRVNREATLCEIKEDVFEEAQKHPLFGALHDKQIYVFTCVNLTSEQEELTDEERRVCDVRPFEAILRLIERKGDKAEKQLNAQIGLLIGKGLHEFDALKNPEVNDFRWKMRIYCEDVERERHEKSWLEKVRYLYPVRVEKVQTFPVFLESRMADGTINIELRFEHSKLCQHFNIEITKCAKDAIEMAITIMNFRDSRCPNEYILKVCGQEEYILGSEPLIQYTYVREMIVNNKVPSFVVVLLNSLQIEEQRVYESIEEVRKRTYSSLPPVANSRKKQVPISAFTINHKLTITINGARRINCSDAASVGIEVGLYQGGEALCQRLSTSVNYAYDGEASWEETLCFDINVCDVPRMARFCFVVYELEGRSRKGSRTKRMVGNSNDVPANPLTWVNTTVFDYKCILRTGSVTLPMWRYSSDIETEDMMHPLGTVVTNPAIEEATCLTVTFDRYTENDTPITYPPLESLVDSLEPSEEANGQNPSEQNTISRKGRQASKAYFEQLRQICARDPLHEMHEQDKELLWYLREDCCHSLPYSLPHLLNSVKWNSHEDVAQMMVLLHKWPQLEPEQALELLDYAYADSYVRGYAVQCLKTINDEDMLLYLLQLTQALKYESFMFNELAQFLLERSLHNQHIGHHLFWLLRSEMHDPAVSVNFGLILEAYCRGSVDHMKSLQKQTEVVNKLTQLNEIVRQEAYERKTSRDKLKALMQELVGQKYYRETLSNVTNPLNPRFKLGRIKAEKCKFMDSKMKPLWLVFSNDDFGAEDVYIIFKNGDDLRQDMLTLQMIRLMDKLWKDEGLDLRMTPYRCISTDSNVGLIEVVLKANTIANIQKEKGSSATSAFKKGSLLGWLKDHNPDEEGLTKAVEEFTLSCAGYCVATYVLGIADRHSDNIMVSSSGRLFHIDFGHILGKFKEKFGIRRERAPFVLTHDFVYVITKGGKQDSFARFQSNCEQAFLILRRKGSFIISLFAMMLNTGIPELSSTKDLNYLRETLVLDLPDNEALKHFRSKFEEALRNSWKTSINWFAHNLAKDNV